MSAYDEFTKEELQARIRELEAQNAAQPKEPGAQPDPEPAPSYEDQVKAALDETDPDKFRKAIDAAYLELTEGGDRDLDVSEYERRVSEAKSEEELVAVVNEFGRGVVA